MSEHEQMAMFDLSEPWREEWIGMPEFNQEDLTSIQSVVVHFSSRSDVELFAELIEQKFTPQTRSVWFPPTEIGRYANKRYIDATEI